VSLFWSESSISISGYLLYLYIG